MLCKCTIKDNYEVIGLCNVGKWSPIETIEPWTQISVPEVLIIPSNKEDIETINKIYNNVEITSATIINTPCADVPNAEGMSLTGKKLLVEGNVCITLVYTAKNLCQSVHPVHFKIPFCTYIIIDSDADIELDQYCVIPCIEDVYAQVLSERLIFINITLFLLAKKQDQVC